MQIVNNFNRIGMGLLSLAVMVGMAVSVHAEDQVEVGEVVVTATRTEQEVKETPAAVQIITREDIDKMGAKNLADALKLATGIDVGSAAMVGGSVTIRGMDTRHGLILIDGERLVSEGSYATANTYEWERINLDNVERIEIVRGPVSSLYGSDALGGVINIITRKSPKQALLISFSPKRYLDHGGVGEDDTFIRYDSGKMGPFAWSLSAGLKDSTPLKNEDNSTKNQFGERKNINFRASYDIGDNHGLEFKADVLREDLKARTMMATSGLNNQWYDNSRDMFSLTFKGQGLNSDYEVRTYFGEQDKKDTTRTRATGVATDFDISSRETWALEGRISLYAGGNHRLTSGGEFRTETYKGTRVDTGKNETEETWAGLSKTSSEADIEYNALYLQDEWTISERLLLIPSLRYDDSDQFSGYLSPKLGMTYKMNDNLRLKANMGKGFKTPSLDDMYMSMVKPMGPLVVHVTGNPDLEPEKSTSYELALEGERGNTFGKLTYFINDVTNLIDSKVTNVVVDGGVRHMYSTYVNEAEADIDGVELEIGHYLGKNLLAKMNYTYLDAINGSGERLQNRAKHRGTFQLHYEQGGENGFSTVLWNEWNKDYLSSVSEQNETYGLWNVSLNKQWSRLFSTYVGVDNIFGKKDEDLNLWGAIWRVGVNFRI